MSLRARSTSLCDTHRRRNAARARACLKPDDHSSRHWPARWQHLHRTHADLLCGNMRKRYSCGRRLQAGSNASRHAGNRSGFFGGETLPARMKMRADACSIRSPLFAAVFAASSSSTLSVARLSAAFYFGEAMTGASFPTPTIRRYTLIWPAFQLSSDGWLTELTTVF